MRRGAAGPAVSVVDRFRPRTDRRFVEQVVRATLDLAGAAGREVSLLLTDDAEIARLHGEFLGDPTPTDVISFDLGDSIEIVVSVECARREARRRGHSIRAETALYVAHGLLHACGHDDSEDSARARMRVAEREVLARLGLRVAPVDEE